jgi:NDP-sugar pyrophosphorylase family protein
MSTEAMNVMLLAAGEGTRLRPYTLEKPKPCIPFLSVPLAFYSLSLLSEINVHNLVTNVFHLPDQVQNLFLKFQNNGRIFLFHMKRWFVRQRWRHTQGPATTDREKKLLGDECG